MYDDLSVDSKELGGAPEREVEVTRAMIEAGIEVLCRSNEDFESKESIVFNIFDAMSGARLLPPTGP
jgi:hypothetical protein